ncbi:elongator complex protein 5 [Aricia agestis]|uniref:elongator complex protein 5 n=1 Tax=Aricia agestis TaxID=91739 RepID=UPI001C207959|nr:elongator complex protein 5 [Aricia agestis]
MTLFKLNAVSTVLVEDDYNKNAIPLVIDMIKKTKSNFINIICYEQSTATWKKVFQEVSGKSQIIYSEKIPINSSDVRSEGSLYFIDSVNQMALDMGWHKCLQYLKKLQTDSSSKTILILHKDCLLVTSKLQIHLNHIANAIISYDNRDPCKVDIQIKKGGKIIKSQETVSYDSTTRTLKLVPVPQISKKTEEPEKVLPSSLSTFKIETDQIQQLEKNKLKLPYMSKINEGQGKVYYEPDAVDDWDEEDPDDDLEI